MINNSMYLLVLMTLAFSIFLSMKTHLLMILLSLEFISLIVLLSLVFAMNFFVYDFSLIIYFIIVMVCEAVMGLVLITLLVRTHGSDYIKSLSLFMC
uniref:NADH-ubiquinone oxidoreductase chain 4L n=1 Tax=Melanastera paucipunctata TaxID=2218046 RepID=A0A344A2A1_9HEMI|nr:NADH dehydrogenase subunit 4L [Diclidophlebia paucipunctata]AWU48892.1 NADH dehydrogenase subunit 4L [Diclidophlebia paucipunctata]